MHLKNVKAFPGFLVSFFFFFSSPFSLISFFLFVYFGIPFFLFLSLFTVPVLFLSWCMFGWFVCLLGCFFLQFFFFSPFHYLYLTFVFVLSFFFLSSLSFEHDHDHCIDDHDDRTQIIKGATLKLKLYHLPRWQLWWMQFPMRRIVK